MMYTFDVLTKGIINCTYDFKLRNYNCDFYLSVFVKKYKYKITILLCGLQL